MRQKNRPQPRPWAGWKQWFGWTTTGCGGGDREGWTGGLVKVDDMIVRMVVMMIVGTLHTFVLLDLNFKLK